MLVIGGYYDKKNGWENTKNGWYEHVVTLPIPFTDDNPILWLEHYDKNYKHVRFIVYDDTTKLVFKVKFRYERDYIMFALRW